jgi:hypothetical protein
MANVQLNVKFLTNRREGQNLALHGYLYRVNSRGPDNSSKTSRTVLKLQRSREQLVVPFDHGPRNT